MTPSSMTSPWSRLLPGENENEVKRGAALPKERCTSFLRREGRDLSKTLPKNGHQFEKVYLFKHPAFVL